MSPKVKIVAGVAVIAIATATTLVFLTDRGAEDDAPAPGYRGHVVHDTAEVAEAYRPLRAPTEIERRFRETASSALAGLPTDEREQIASRAAQLTAIFLEGSFDDYRQALLEQGLPESGWMADEASAREAWRAAQGNFASSVLNLDAVRMHAPVADMYIRKDVAGLKNEMIVRSLNKPAGPGNVHPFSPDAQLRDVAIPLTVTTIEGTEFQAELVLGFGRRNSDGQWVLATVRINNVPANETIRRMMI